MDVWLVALVSFLLFSILGKVLLHHPGLPRNRYGRLGTFEQICFPRVLGLKACTTRDGDNSQGQAATNDARNL